MNRMGCPWVYGPDPWVVAHRLIVPANGSPIGLSGAAHGVLQESSHARGAAEVSELLT